MIILLMGSNCAGLHIQAEEVETEAMSFKMEGVTVEARRPASLPETMETLPWKLKKKPLPSMPIREWGPLWASMREMGKT